MREVKVQKDFAAGNTVPTASLAPWARAFRSSARRTRTVISQVARSTTGGAAGAGRTGMTAASRGAGTDSIGLADDLGSVGTVPFGCLLLYLRIRVALGVLFWRVFWGIHLKSMYIDLLSHRNCVQLSQSALATSSHIRDCLSSAALSAVSLLLPSLSLSCDFRGHTVAACAAGIPFVSWAETTRDFRSRIVSSGPIRRCSCVPKLGDISRILAMGFRHLAMGNGAVT